MYKMKCGHSPNSTIFINGEWRAYCAICDCDEVVPITDSDTKNKEMKCSCCGRILPSNNQAAFFKFEPNQKYDSFYCGCQGWD